ncbi:GyrI-like domain-containing protein [Microbacterium pseudoresistens]|uniref:GyrI-like small molecule binding domain-containing protein n=1 Tax=Microbacterium pseudoresistens TaxID=640634 RepID=A0A7Y9EWM2_9MICO|nr:hypothetical protein [Microbacterium pseudoresistens]
MKTDLKKEIPAYSARKGRFDVISVPPLQYLMIDGAGDPNTSSAYGNALASLYPLAYGLKFFSKKELDRDYAVMPLEGLWWADDLSVFTANRDKSQWSWTMMILTPDWITAAHVDTTRATAAAKGTAPAIDRIRLEALDEGLCVQTLHVGPYDDEGPVLARLHDEFLPAQGLHPTGKHHEIYLGDPRRSAPEKLRTILRQPVKRS